VDRVLSTLSEGHVIYTDPDGVEWIAVYKSMIGYNRYRGVRWGVILRQRTRDAFAAADQAARNAALIALAVALLLLAGSVPLARWLSRPLVRLASYARALGQNSDLALAPPALDLQRRADEIGGLALAMTAMTADLQQHRAAQEARHEALRRAERLASLGFLAAGVAHEINNPLTTILGYGELLLEDKAPDHPDRASLELIAAEAARVREIVRGLLDMSRRPHAREDLDLGDLIDRALTLSRAGLRMDHVHVQRRPPPAPVTLHADRHGLLQVVMNLISNAVDALEDKEDQQLTIQWREDERGVTLSVADNGEGMTAEVAARLFEPFFTTKAAGRGTGLGMAILSRIIVEHGGEVSFTSAPGEGTCFEVRLPRASAPA
jgi:signal transduction histidine kinase